MPSQWIGGRETERNKASKGGPADCREGRNDNLIQKFQLSFILCKKSAAVCFLTPEIYFVLEIWIYSLDLMCLFFCV